MEDTPKKIVYKKRAPNAKLDPRNDTGLYQRIFELGRLRVTQEEAAAVLGVHVSNFRAFLKSDEAAQAAWDDGREMCKVSIRRQLFLHAKDDPATARYLANNFLDLSNDPSKNRAIENQGSTAAMNREEAMARILELQGKVVKDITPKARQLARSAE